MAQGSNIKIVKLGDNLHDINAKYIQADDAIGTPKTWADIKALIKAVGFEVVVDKDGTASGPSVTASADTMGKIYLVAAGAQAGSYVEWITVHDAAASPQYKWEKIGTTATDLTNYLQKDVTYNAAALSNGAHEHTVSGSTTVPTVSKTNKNLGVSRTTDVAVAGNGTAAAITGFGTHPTANVLGANADIEVSGGTPSKTYIKATASGTALNTSSKDTFVKSYPGTSSKLKTTSIVPAVSNGTVIPAVANGQATKTVFGTNVQASYVEVTPGTAASLTGRALPTYTQGTPASWAATVSTDGVLSFRFDANVPGTYTQGSLGTFTPNVPTAVIAAPVTVPVVESNASVDVAKAGSAVTVAKAGTAVTVATGELATDATGASVLTSLGEAVTAQALTGVTVSTQPTITLATDSTSGTGKVQVVTDVSAVTAEIDPTDTKTVLTGLGTPTTADVLTGVKVSTQPAFTLNGNATSGVSYVDSVTIGTTTAALNSGKAASAGAHTHDVKVNS